MKTADIIRRAGRSLKQAKARTLLTSLAIGVGAFTITLSLAAGAGGKAYTNQIVSANTDQRELVITKKAEEKKEGPQEYKEQNGLNTTGSPFGEAPEPLTDTDIQKIRALKEVESVSPDYSPQVKYITRESQNKYAAMLSTFSSSVDVKYVAGGVENELADNEIILTQEYATALGFPNNSDAIGKTVQIVADKLSAPVGAPESQTFEYTIRGVSDKSGLALRAQGSLLISNGAAKAIYEYTNADTRSYGIYFLASAIVKDPNQAEAVKNQLSGMGYDAQTAKDILGVIDTFINVLQGILLGFGALAVLTSIFGIINTQYISVLERTQQIGLMKALGMRRRDIGRLFKIEAAWIGFLGGVIGSGFATAAGLIANPFISKALDIGDVSLLIFNPFSLVGIVVGLMLVSVTAGILPARKAAKLDPVEALRTE